MACSRQRLAHHEPPRLKPDVRPLELLERWQTFSITMVPSIRRAKVGDTDMVVRILIASKEASLPETIEDHDRVVQFWTRRWRDYILRGSLPFALFGDGWVFLADRAKSGNWRFTQKFLVFAKDVFEAISAEVSTGAVYDMTPREWREAKRKWRGAGDLLTKSILSGGFTLPITSELAASRVESS